jgi:hypothetical protein
VRGIAAQRPGPDGGGFAVAGLMVNEKAAEVSLAALDPGLRRDDVAAA